MTVPQPRKIHRRKHAPGVLVAVAVLLAAPFVGLLWVGSYNAEKPHLWGFPFFYWYQLMWVIVAAIATSIAYLLITRTGHEVDIDDEPTAPSADSEPRR